MSKKNPNEGAMGQKALEMVMQDVLGGMDEYAIMKSYEAGNSEFKVIAIKPRVLWSTSDAINEFTEVASFGSEQESPRADVINLDEYRKRVKSRS